MDGDQVGTHTRQAGQVEHTENSEAAPRLPKKRFIGRRAAAEKAAARSDPNASIEDSGAIQGTRYGYPLRSAVLTT